MVPMVQWAFLVPLALLGWMVLSVLLAPLVSVVSRAWRAHKARCSGSCGQQRAWRAC